MRQSQATSWLLLRWSFPGEQDGQLYAATCWGRKGLKVFCSFANLAGFACWVLEWTPSDDFIVLLENLRTFGKLHKNLQVIHRKKLFVWSYLSGAFWICLSWSIHDKNCWWVLYKIINISCGKNLLYWQTEEPVLGNPEGEAVKLTKEIFWTCTI